VSSRDGLNGFRKSRSLRIMSMKNSRDTIENRTGVLPACNAVPQPTAPPRASRRSGDKFYCIFNVGIMSLCVVRFTPSDKRSVRIALSRTKFFSSPLKYCINNKFRFDQLILTCICLMAGVSTRMTFNTTSTVKLCQSIIVMTSQRDNTMRHDNALQVTCHSRCASHRTMHMSYRSKTYTWNDVILVKRSMIRVFFSLFNSK
jgi:hypothetical protein